MLAIAIGLLLIVAVAVSIVMVVALPHVRNGSRILTPDGERVVERVREQAVQKPVAAAETTWNGLVAAREKAARAWEPASAALHEKLDRLEAPHAGTESPSRPDTEPAGRLRDIRPVEGRPEPEVCPAARPAGPQTRPMTVTRSQPAAPARPVIGGPRPVPPISGPIPVGAEPGRAGAAGGQAGGVEAAEAAEAAVPGGPADRTDQVIDLREDTGAPAPGRSHPCR